MSEKEEEVQSADYYYSKALAYLSMAHDDAQPTCSCQHCHSDEDDEDDDFSMGFRRSLVHDHSQGSSSNSGSDVTRTSPTSSPSKSEQPRQRRHSVIERPKISGDEFAKPLPQRKLSDGHVHWADEFQKELTRCRPRKSYTRHPSHVTPSIKPILKAAPEEDDQDLPDDYTI